MKELGNGTFVFLVSYFGKWNVNWLFIDCISARAFS